MKTTRRANKIRTGGFATRKVVPKPNQPYPVFSLSDLEFREFSDLSGLYFKIGVYVVKRKNSPVIYSIGESQCNLYKTIQKIRTRLSNDEYEFAVIVCEVGHFVKVKRQIRKEYLRIPLDEDYNKILPLIEKGKKVEILEVIKPRLVKPFYINGGGKERFTLKYYKWRFGVYFVFENYQLVYVGMSGGVFWKERKYNFSWIDVTLYSHFTKYTEDRENGHYRVSFYKTRHERNYEVCIVEVPLTSSSSIEGVRDNVNYLERELIKILQPKYNVKGIEETREELEGTNQYDYDFPM